MTKRSALERVLEITDPGSFIEIGKDMVHRGSGFALNLVKKAGDGVVTGIGKVDGRVVAIYSQDSSFVGGSVGEIHGQKILNILNFARENLCPVLGIVDSGGARIHEGVLSLGIYGEIFRKNVELSGLVPQITVVLGACAGGAVYSPALTDFVLASKDSFLFITGPDVVEAVTGRRVSKLELGGPQVHEIISGVIDLVGEDDSQTIFLTKALLSYIPQNYSQIPRNLFVDDSPFRETPTLKVVAELPSNQPYDVKDVVKDLLDHSSFFEIKPNHGKSLVIGFGCLDGKVVGIVANQPLEVAGCLDVESSVKGARFVRFCNCFNIPILALVDVPGFLPGIDQEEKGIIKHGSKLLFAFCELSVPRVTLILKKAYGGAYDVMNSKHVGANFVFALPNSEIAVMGPEAASKIVFKSEIKNNPQKAEDLAKKYRDEIANVKMSLEYGFIDKIIDPLDSRKELINAFKLIKHSPRTCPLKNIPL
ncbi:MAG: acyl-CoA carboxylase subunit beta [Deltaproteobacteria bacterium]|nr:acyl-CoA carboxylase subunit beta [Deltaproteobacteria bacterium]